MNKSFNIFFEKYISKLTSSLNNSDLLSIEKAASKIYETIKKKNTIFVCGNGGSAAIANHYICDYLKFLRQHSKLKPKVISLSSNLETITAISNDFNYDQSVIGDHVWYHTWVNHYLENLHRSLWMLALFAGTDQSVVGNYIWHHTLSTHSLCYCCCYCYCCCC